MKYREEINSKARIKGGSMLSLEEDKMSETLREIQKIVKDPETIIVCTGNILRGDDGVGIYIGRKLEELGLGGKVIVAEGGIEASIGEIRRAQGKRILLIDAVQANLKPGDIILTKVENIRETHLLITHRIPIRIIAEILKQLYKVKEILILGIQVEKVDVREGISRKVRETADKIVEIILETLEKVERNER